MKLRTQPPNLLAQFQRLSLSSTPLRPPIFSSLSTRRVIPFVRSFSTTRSLAGTWLLPSRNEKHGRAAKGRPRVHTGGSVVGTTVVWGDYGIRLKDYHRRLSAKQLKNAEDAIKGRLRGLRYKLYKRVAANIAVYTKGNEVRMGKGKGSFDYWASRVSVSHLIFELKGDIHEQIIRDAFRLAGNKMPGTYEFVKKGDPPVVGITKLKNGLTLEDLKRPRRKISLGALPPGATPLTTASTSISPTT